MPTYDYKCDTCGREESTHQSIGEYVSSPIRPGCCGGAMERKLSINPAFSGLANALAGDRHYDGLRSTDGADISTRSKHREYMKSKGITMASDYKETWKKEAEKRDAFYSGTPDTTLKKDVREVVERAIGT